MPLTNSVFIRFLGSLFSLYGSKYNTAGKPCGYVFGAEVTESVNEEVSERASECSQNTLKNNRSRLALTSVRSPQMPVTYTR